MKKWLLIFLVTMIGSLSIGMHVDAVEKNSYESNSGIGFYGVYKYPDTGNESDLVPPSSNVSGGMSDKEWELSTLPQTGNINSSYLQLIGMFTLISSFLVMLIKKTKTGGIFQ